MMNCERERRVGLVGWQPEELDFFGRMAAEITCEAIGDGPRKQGCRSNGRKRRTDDGTEGTQQSRGRT